MSRLALCLAAFAASLALAPTAGADDGWKTFDRNSGPALGDWPLPGSAGEPDTGDFVTGEFQPAAPATDKAGESSETPPAETPKEN